MEPCLFNSAANVTHPTACRCTKLQIKIFLFDTWKIDFFLRLIFQLTFYLITFFSIIELFLLYITHLLSIWSRLKMILRTNVVRMRTRRSWCTATMSWLEIGTTIDFRAPYIPEAQYCPVWWQKRVANNTSRAPKHPSQLLTTPNPFMIIWLPEIGCMVTKFRKLVV